MDKVHNSISLTKDLFAILSAKNVGYIRDLPSVNGKYGCPMSKIYITLKNTNLTETECELRPGKCLYYYVKNNFIDNENYMIMHYKHPDTNEPTAPSTMSIKEIEVSFY